MAEEPINDVLAEGKRVIEDRKGDLTFTGDAGEFFRIWIANVILTIVTLGIYRFWAVSKERQYIWSHIHYLGDEFEWTGTGKELFRGFLTALLTIVLPLTLMVYLAEFLIDTDYAGLSLLLYVVVFLAGLVLAPLAFYRGAAYRISRTQWRGIRGAQSGQGWGYVGNSFAYAFLTSLTAGLAGPYADAGLHRHLMAKRSFGNFSLTNTAPGGELLAAFFQAAAFAIIGNVLLVAALFALATQLPIIGDETLRNDVFNSPVSLSKIHLYLQGGLLSFSFVVVNAYGLIYYRVARLKLFLTSQRVRSRPLRLDLTVWRFSFLVLGYVLLVILTLGLAYPWVLMRSLQLIIKSLHSIRRIPVDTLEQTTEPTSQGTEGMLDALEAGGFA